MKNFKVVEKLKLYACGCLVIFILTGFQTKTEQLNNDIYLIPQPVKLEKLEGNFEINKKTEINLISQNEQILFVADFFNSIFSDASGFNLKINKLSKVTNTQNRITLEITNEVIQKEGYLLSVTKKGIHLKANEAVGLFYGIQTLRQLLPLKIDSSIQTNIKWTVPAVSIIDYPSFGWRGLHLDVSRHFFPKEFIKKYIDYMVRYKLNVFHWHLVDGDGWRLPIDAYPNLIQTGAWRVDKTKEPWDWRETEIGIPTDGRPVYGGFYTKDDIREIVKYASDRFVQVIPEIEMPGHSYAALVSYPELSCLNNNVVKEGVYGKDVFCAGNEKSYDFFKTVIDETLELFPSKLIHIGGDEVSKQAWQNCSRCQSLMKNEGLKNEDELQSYFIKKMANYIESKGREIIGWDEILEGGLAPNAKVMSWRGTAGGIKSANLGHDVVMAPNTYTYFDLYQGEPSMEPPAYSKLFLTDVYKFDPIPKDIEPSKQHHILGGHACLWTETIQTPEQAEYMLFPRLFAFAETIWTPKDNLNLTSFIDRVEYNFNRLNNAGINHSKSIYNVKIDGVLDTINHALTVSMHNEVNRYQIRYTVDGTDPAENSLLYKEPFTINEETVIKASTFKTDSLIGKISSKEYLKHLANWKDVVYKNKYTTTFSGGGTRGLVTGGSSKALVNGLIGSNDHLDGNWQGFKKSDVEVIVDLGENLNINFIKTNFFHKPSRLIYLPKNLIFSISNDGIHFKDIAKYSTLENPKLGANSYEKKILNQKARYIKVFAENIGFRPNTTSMETWLLIDEIIVQ